MTTPTPSNPRLTSELALLTAIYPSELSHSPALAQLTYADPTGTLALRIPDEYPAQPPTVLTASLKPSGRDVRERIRGAIGALEQGEEALDVIVEAFRDVCADASPETETDTTAPATATEEEMTMVVWLHHLLAPSKRKIALHPSSTSTSRINGLTKPGHPGVLIYSGPCSLVEAHVAELRALSWQAFQVRYQERESWGFGHGRGVREVARMGEVVEGVEERWRGALVRVLGVR